MLKKEYSKKYQIAIVLSRTFPFPPIIISTKPARGLILQDSWSICLTRDQRLPGPSFPNLVQRRPWVRGCSQPRAELRKIYKKKL